MTAPIALASVTLSGIELEQVRSLLRLIVDEEQSTLNERLIAARLRSKITRDIERHIKEQGE